MSSVEGNCTLLIAPADKVGLPTQAELVAELESTDVQRKSGGLKKAILMVLSGEDMPRMLMTVIRYCITVEDHTLQKLLMLYYEVARKHDAAGKLLPEMILVCNALRNNLISPNEYIRGCTLRFLTKLREPELLESLIPSIKACLGHRHPYVRRNAVLAVFMIFRAFPDLFPDAPEEVVKFMEEESDAGTRRNAFVMMFQCAPDQAIAFLTKNVDKVLQFGDGFALILLELIRKTVRSDASRKPKFIRIVFSLLENAAPAVAYEAASTLVSLSAAPSAIRAASQAFIRVLLKESDNNVKLIVLDRLASLRKRHAKVLREQVMDVLRCLATPNNDIRRRTLDVAMDLVSPRNVEEVMGLLKKEILATPASGSSSGSKGGDGGSGSSGSQNDPEDSKYRTMLISAIHGCAVRFPEVAPSVVQLLMDFLNGDGALSVIEFVREIVETYPEMRAGVLTKLRSVMPDIGASEVFRVALWLLGQYSLSDEEVQTALHCIRECIGPLPLITPWETFVAQAHAAAAAERDAAAASASEASSGAGATSKAKKPAVLADGTYASQSAITAPEARAASASEADDALLPPLRRLLLGGDFFLGSVVASTLTKLALRVSEHHGREARLTKGVFVDAMLVMCALMELGASGLAGTPALLPASALAALAGSRGGYRTGGGAAGVALDAAAAGLPGQPLGFGMPPGAGMPGAMGGAPGGGPLGTAAAAAAASVSSAGVRIDQDSFERVTLCMRVLGDPASTAAALPVLLHSCKDTFHQLLVERRARAAQAAKDGVQSTGASLLGVTSAPGAAGGPDAAKDTALTGPSSRAAVDDPLSIRLLRPNRATGLDEVGWDDDADVTRAAGTMEAESFSERLKRVHQLTGFADPVYCEAFVKVHEYDVVLELAIINRTDTTLTNVTVELSTMGDLKLVERPASFTLAPRDSRTLRANIKVSSTETGHIFGTVVYDTPASIASGTSNVVNLCEIHVDIMDYILPAVCSDSAFRSMWADFEWENKVTVNTNVGGLAPFIEHIARVTNMRILTPIHVLAGSQSQFLAANLYARSIFGEDALVNVSVENKPDGSIKGHIRIRAKTQGVALSLGDRITSKQKLAAV